MKLLLLCVVALAAAWMTEDEIVAKVNSQDGVTWTAKKSIFADWTVEQFKQLLGTNVHHHMSASPAVPAVTSNAPDTFDWRVTNPGCSTGGYGVRDQAQCGSCWAFAAAEVLADRYCIAGKPHGALSPQDLVSCDYLDDACNGGSLDTEWSWIRNHGITTEACFPYTSQSGSVEACRTTCKDGSAIARYKCQNYQHTPQSVPAIQAEIQKGPVEVAFDVYEDFRTYHTGVYKHTTGGYLGGHAVAEIGWGTEAGVDYWLCQNSWGTSWAGLSGYFKILRGSNHCGIEGRVYSGNV